MGSILKSRDRIHKSTRHVEWCHANVDIKHSLPEGGTSGGVESFEGEKHLTETTLAILLRREKITILPSSNCLSGSTFLNDEIKGGDKGLEVPIPLSQVGVTEPE